jgi:hypothetical protein
MIALGWAVACGAMVPDGARAEWQEHSIRQGDGMGGWVTRPALRQVLKHPDATATMPFGIVQMDNGELALVCSRERQPPQGPRTFEPSIAFSKDDGASWSEFVIIPGTRGRPQYLTHLGQGRLSFVSEALGEGATMRRYFSDDRGRTWNESIAHPPTKEGRSFNLEGNAWVDRDEQGRAKVILELGWHLLPGKSHPKDDFTVVFRRSVDGGKTWIDEVSPPQWKFTVEHNGKRWLRGVSEGAIARAANGDLVAALRTDMPPRYFDEKNDDSLEGTSMSISRDDGKSWSDMNILFDAGRHHANLQRLPNGDLVCTLVVRDDIQHGKLVSHRRGCDALISHDHGKTWNLDRRYELDRFDYVREDGYWVDGKCGHIGAVVLNDGHIISAYGNYPQGAVLIKWKPNAEPVEPLASPTRAATGLFDQAKQETLGLAAIPEISGIYPHLAMFNDESGVRHRRGGSLGRPVVGGDIRAAPPKGSTDKLYEVTRELRQIVRPESIGGTPANRLIHRESQQLFIGPYAIDSQGRVRVIPYERMFGRPTGNARHLTDPAHKIYYATMEEGLYEVDVRTLAVAELWADEQRPTGRRTNLPGYHGKGLFAAQGRVIYANNGEHGPAARRDPETTSGVLAEWDGRADVGPWCDDPAAHEYEKRHAAIPAGVQTAPRPIAGPRSSRSRNHVPRAIRSAGEPKAGAAAISTALRNYSGSTSVIRRAVAHRQHGRLPLCESETQRAVPAPMVAGRQYLPRQ